MKPGDLSWDEAMKLAAVDREQLIERLNRDQYSWSERYDGWLRRWHWRVQIATTGVNVASGRALTKRAAIRRRHRAYLKALNS
jgi:hypothetical protein